MAASPSHRFGQIVGTLLEELLLPVLSKFCVERKLFLDQHGDRVGVRKGKKVTWADKYGNSHDLDFVIEKNGSTQSQGRPVAFIEAAWRRYTKHSRAKAQEIQGAVLPIAELYGNDSPFLGAVLAGEFTTGSLDQLRSLGFKLVYIPYATVVKAFAQVGIDIQFDEETEDAKFAECVGHIEKLKAADRTKLKDFIYASNEKIFEAFFETLRSKLDRLVEKVVVLPLFGASIELKTLDEARFFVSDFKTDNHAGEFRKYEISVLFSNGDAVNGIFSTKERAVAFLDYLKN